MPAALARPAGNRGALPTWAVDLIRVGASPDDLRARGTFAVDQALKATAKSAINAGMAEDEWWVNVDDSRSELGRQVGTIRDKNGRPKRATTREVLKRREKAWERAWEEVGGRAPFTTSEVQAEAVRRADAVRSIVEDLGYLTPEGRALEASDRAVLAYLGESARRRGLTRVAESRRAIMRGTGLGRTAVDNALGRITAFALIRKYRRGRAGAASQFADIWEVLPPGRRASSPTVAIGAGLRPAYGAPQGGDDTYGAPAEGSHRSGGSGAHMVPPIDLTAYIATASPSERTELRALLDAADGPPDDQREAAA